MQRRALSKSPRATSRSRRLQKQSVAKPAPKPRIIGLQQSIGNRAVQRLLRSHHIQAKLQVSTPGDQYEQEADRVADTVMRMSDGNTLQRQPLEKEEKPLEKRAGEEDETVHRKAEDGNHLEVSPQTETQVDTLRGGGQPLPESMRAHFEPRFGYDFSGVRLHTGSDGAKAANAVSAKAFTLGSDIAFAAGQYSPETSSGKRLLAHELTHVVQQGGVPGTVQRVDHVADTGFRYTPPASVTRSIVEIQGIVGTTPDGVYGENTRRAVEKYQTKLKDVGFYTDTLDGKWGKNTEAAHVSFATTDTTERRGYNCTGFAVKSFGFHGLAATRAMYATMTKLADCSKPCNPFFHKFFMWDYDLRQVDNTTGASSATVRDFHTVAGQTDKSGNGPAQVMSKNGKRPVEGPKPPMDWKPLTGPTSHPITGLPMPNFTTIRTGHVEECFCNEKLPGRP